MKTYSIGGGSQSLNYHTRITSLEDLSTLKTWAKKVKSKNDLSFSGLMNTSTMAGSNTIAGVQTVI